MSERPLALEPPAPWRPLSQHPVERGQVKDSYSCLHLDPSRGAHMLVGRLRETGQCQRVPAGPQLGVCRLPSEVPGISRRVSLSWEYRFRRPWWEPVS